MIDLQGIFSALRRRHREKRLVRELRGLSDHYLADIGLRRDQLQPDGIRELDLPPRPTPAHPPGVGWARRPRRDAAVYPSLQGCG